MEQQITIHLPKQILHQHKSVSHSLISFAVLNICFLLFFIGNFVIGLPCSKKKQNKKRNNRIGNVLVVFQITQKNMVKNIM